MWAWTNNQNIEDGWKKKMKEVRQKMYWASSIIKTRCNKRKVWCCEI